PVPPLTPLCPQGNLGVSVTYGGPPLPKSPFSVGVSPGVDLAKIKISGLDDSKGGRGILGGPFPVEVVPATDPSKVRAFGPGLQGGLAGVPAPFTIDTKGAGTGGLGLTVEGPCEAKIECQDNGDGTCSVSYLPTEPGDYNINILFAGTHIPGSPFRAPIRPKFDPSKVTCEGPGLEKATAGQPGRFRVDCSRAGTAELTIGIASEAGARADVRVEENGDGIYTIAYTPRSAGVHTVTVEYGGQPVPHFPSTVRVEPAPAAVDTSGIKVYGPGVEGKGEFGDRGDGTYHVEYTPYEEGLHKVDVSYGGSPVPLSPFRVPVTEGCDPGRVRVHGPGIQSGTTNQPNKFTVETRPSGVLEPVDVADNGDGTRRVSYVPSREGPYTISVRYGDHEVPRSPFKVKALPTHDASKVRASGPGLNTTGVPASLPVEFTIDAKDAGEGLLAVQITDPEGKPKKASIRDNQDGTYTVSYVPDMTGRYTILIKYGGDEIPYSPYRIRAVPTGDASKCTVTVSIGGHGLGPGLGPTIQLGEQTLITVDAKAAGKGKVTCSVCTPDGSEVDVDVVENPDGTFDIFYTAPQPGKYVICVRFGGEHIPNSPFQVMATDRPLLGVNGLDMAGLRPFDLVIPFTIKKGEITGEVRMPSGKVATPDITDNKDGTVTVRFAPSEAGLHEMDIRCDSIHIPGSPLQFYVDYVNSGHVTAYGPGLTHGTVNRPAAFTVNTKDAGEGGLSLAVEGPSKAEISCQDNGDGTCSVSYLPVLPGDYGIVVKYNDKHIAGSPFTARITGDDSLRQSHLKVGASAEIPLDIGESDLSQLSATVTAPSGRREPCSLKRLRDGHLGISFVPQEVGEHLVHVTCGEQPLPCVPVPVSLCGSRLSPRRLGLGTTFQPAQFTIDTRQAGYGGLSLSIEGPSKVDITTEELEDGTCRVSYCPTEPGNYIISVKFGDQHVPELSISDVTAQVTSPTLTIFPILSRFSPIFSPELSISDVTAQVTELSISDVTVQVTELSISDVTAQVTGPSGQALSISDVTAQVTGPSGQANCPSQMSRRRTLHLGRHRTAEFSIWTREAGAGGLSIAVEGPSKAEIAFEDHKDGSCGVSYVVQEPGDYEVSVKFNDEHIPESPFVVTAAAPSDAARRLTVSSLQESGLKVHQPASFAVSLNGARGALDAKVHSPSGALEECHISEVTPDKYAVRFIPRENGVYSIDVKFEGSHIPGSPFKVRVGEPGQAGDPGLVSAYGPGLEGGTTGSPAEFVVNTSKAGPGALAVTIEGPSKVTMECHECPEGFRVSYTPMAPGSYLIAIKFGGPHHIVGSPFKAKITAPPAASPRMRRLHPQPRALIGRAAPLYDRRARRSGSTRLYGGPALPPPLRALPAPLPPAPLPLSPASAAAIALAAAILMSPPRRAERRRKWRRTGSGGGPEVAAGRKWRAV
uniref:filamin-A-like n=1 Tax=Lonchura striata TaxID=40157 RepID=UPI0012930319